MARDRRAHVLIPDDLLQDVDALVGPRRRSEFLVEAAREKLARETLRREAHKLGGSLADVETPGWETSEASREWVRALRRESDERRLGSEGT
jgi:metal-responsive CopG/Arc/MetJ family transcriptional regulator